MRETLSPTDFVKIATSAARHYGFDTIDTAKAMFKEEQTLRRPPLPRIIALERKTDALGGLLTAGISSYIDSHLHGSSRPVLFSTLESAPRTGEISVGLHIIGMERSIAEALLIHATRSMFADFGYDSHTVRINSLGDRESQNRYTRELTNFMRKRIEELPPTARELLKQHALYALNHLIEKDHEMSYRAPSPLEYLSDQSRKHFRELVEYLDVSNAFYEIDTRLLGNHQCYSDALFSITPKNQADEGIVESPISVRGGRYDEFVKRLTKVNIPATGAIITFNTKKVPSRLPKIDANGAPNVFLVQLGFGPKMKSLLLLEELRASKIRAHHIISSDSLGEQLALAERMKVPFALILGQKEFVEKSIIVRDLRSRSQEIIPLTSLTSHLKRILKV